MKYMLSVFMAAAIALCAVAQMPAQVPTIQPTDFTYLGAFRLSNPSETAPKTLNYSTGVIAFSPTGNGGVGSILVASHVYGPYLGEWAIPTPSLSRTLSALPVASMIRPFTSVRFSNASPQDSYGPSVLGAVWVPSLGRFAFTFDDDYTSGSCTVDSFGTLGTFLPDLTGVQGGWTLAGLPHFQTSRYIVALPPTWAATYAGDALVASGRHRNWCDMGPDLYAWSPAGQAAGAAIASKVLIKYGPEGDTAHQAPGFVASDTQNGAAWITLADGRQVYAVSGIKDFDPARAYYGYANWVRPAQCEPTNTCQGYRGWRAGDARGALKLYAPDDLAAVASGTKASWTVGEYAVYDFSAYMLNLYGPTFLTTGNEAHFSSSFDPATGRLYISEPSVDGGLRPVIHVFQVGTGGGTPPPLPMPTSTLTVVPTSLQAGQSAVVTWTSSNATSVFLDGLSVALSGSQAVTLSATHMYTLVATGAGGSVTRTATVTVTPVPPPSTDTTPPTVAITSPANGATVWWFVIVRATATDNVGVAGVQFYLDGKLLGSEDRTAPYGYTWSAYGSARGPHVLTAVARDAAGNRTTSAPVAVKR